MEFEDNHNCSSNVVPSMDSNVVPSMDSNVDPNISSSMGSKGNDEFPLPVIVCIAKLEHDYIEEFMKYHLALGFKRIYLFDNEDVPTYATLLKKYVDSGQVLIYHLPHNNHYIMKNDVQCFIPVQYLALHIFVEQIMPNSDITHVVHIDIDEFIALKRHSNICDFIKEYIVGDCAGIGMNWRIFGSSNRAEKTNAPVTARFTMCEEKGHQCIKTIFKKDCFVKFDTCHAIVASEGMHIKSTNGTIPEGPFNFNVDYDVIQLNHYKCKTLPEFKYIRTRQRADKIGETNEDVNASFKQYDINEIEELTARKFYQSII